jgi:hypothetical protein
VNPGLVFEESFTSTSDNTLVPDPQRKSDFCNVKTKACSCMLVPNILEFDPDPTTQQQNNNTRSSHGGHCLIGGLTKLLHLFKFKVCKSVHHHTIQIIQPTFCFLWRCDPTRVTASSFLRFLDHTQRRTTVGRTPLDE